MKKSNRGFGGHGECMAVIAVFAVGLAVVFPVFSEAYKTSIRHGNVPAVASALALGCCFAALLVAFVIAPLALALPIVCFVKLTRRRAESFREVLFEYWGPTLCALIGLLAACGWCGMIWDMAIRPIMHHFRH